MYYRVAKPTEYLVITGFRIEDIKLAKKAWILPGQSCTTLDVSPVNYTIKVHTMSFDKRPLFLHAVFTIGPKADHHQSLLKYAKLLSAHHKRSQCRYVNELVHGIIEGKTRDLVAFMTMEEIFNDTKEFKNEVFEEVQLQLNQFGLFIYNANVKQLVGVESQKAEILTKASLTYETKVHEANAFLYNAKKTAEAVVYDREKQAEAMKAMAEAQLYVKRKEAEGLMALGEAQATYLRSLLDSLGGNYIAVRDYVMINNGMFRDIARINADAIRGLQPKISVSTNPGQAGDSDGDRDGSATMKEVAGVYKMLPPLFKTVQEQTAWMGTLSNTHNS